MSSDNNIRALRVQGEFHDNLPRFAYWGYLISSEFQTSFELVQNSQDKNVNQDRCSTPGRLQLCGPETAL